ncbi:MAG: hypothetical protein V3V13_09870 [Paracoccaceae bacterium]
MGKSNGANRYSTEVHARAVRMIFEHEHENANQSAAIMAIAPTIGGGRDTLRRWVKQSDIDGGRKDGQTSDDRGFQKSSRTSAFNKVANAKTNYSNDGN